MMCATITLLLLATAASATGAPETDAEAIAMVQHRATARVTTAGESHWAILGRSDVDNAEYTEECLSDEATKYEESLGTGWNDNTIATSCCNSKGEGSRPGCKEGQTYQEAHDHCVNEGLRLCTEQELRADKSAGTGCSFDLTLNWSSDKCRVSYWAVIGKSTVANAKRKEECLSDEATKYEESLGTGWDENTIATSCCNSKGEGSRPGCKEGQTHREAHNHCVKEGLRLCTEQELRADKSAGKGCNFDLTLSWSKDQCHLEEEKEEPTKWAPKEKRTDPCDPVVSMHYSGRWGWNSEWGTYGDSLGSYILDHYGDDGRPVYRKEQETSEPYAAWRGAWLWLVFEGDKWVAKTKEGTIRNYIRSEDTQAKCPADVSSWWYNIGDKWQKDGRHTIKGRSTYWSYPMEKGSNKFTRCANGFAMRVATVEGDQDIISCQLATTIPALKPQLCGQVVTVENGSPGERQDDAVGRSAGDYVAIDETHGGRQVYEYVGPYDGSYHMFYDAGDSSWKIGTTDKKTVWFKSANTTACPSDAGGWLTFIDNWKDLRTTVTRGSSYDVKNRGYYGAKRDPTCAPGFVVSGLWYRGDSIFVRCAVWEGNADSSHIGGYHWRQECNHYESAIGMKDAYLYCCPQSQTMTSAIEFAEMAYR